MRISRPHRDTDQGKAERRSLRVVGLFAGVGGLETGLASAGHRTVRLCEIDTAARAVLRRRFPGVPLDRDIREMKEMSDRADLIAAGFPCQDLSQAGRTRGFNGKHSSLVGCVLDLLAKTPVPWILLENVPFMLYLHKGHTLRTIVDRLESMGYKWAYRIVDTRAFGLPQRRRRVFLLAAQDNDPRDVLLSDDHGPLVQPITRNGAACGFYWTEGNAGIGWAIDAVPPLKGGSLLGIPSPPAIALPGGKVVTPDIRDAERLQGFEACWTQPANGSDDISRSVRWRLVGNAVTVPVARWIGRRLRSPLPYDDTKDIRLRRSDPWPRAAWNVGEGRFTATVSEWPVVYRQQSLAAFLKYPPRPLSARAAQGFLDRVMASGLNIEPSFLSQLRRHITSMTPRTDHSLPGSSLPKRA